MFLSAGSRVEETGGEDTHVYGTSRLAHCVSEGGEIQENPQEHHDQHDGHSRGGHKKTGGI